MAGSGGAPASRVLVASQAITRASAGRFSAHPADSVIMATAGGGALRLWGAPSGGKPGGERATEPLAAPVLCQTAVRVGGVELLFVLHAGMRWRLLQLDGASLLERGSGTLAPPEAEPEETLFGRQEVICCPLRARGEGYSVLLAVWDRWLTVLQLEGDAPVAAHLPLARAGAGAALPTGAGLPPRVVRMATWAGGEGIADSAADPLGNPAVALLYADDGLRLMSVQCVNLDLQNHAVLPGPWGLQNVGTTEAEASCDIVPLLAWPGAEGVGSGVLVVGQDVVTYISGDGEQAAQLSIEDLPGGSAGKAPAACWQCCQMPSAGGVSDAEMSALLVGSAARDAGRACLLSVRVGARAGRMHCGSGGADSVELSATAVALPIADEESVLQRGYAALVAGGPGQVVGCAADGRLVDFTADRKGKIVPKQMPMPGWWAGSNGCAEVHATACVPLTRRLPGVPSSSGGPAAAVFPVCETALAVCGTDDRRGADTEGGCVLLGRVGSARVTTVAAAASFQQLPSTLHALLLPDGTSFLLCSFGGTTRGTQILSMSESSGQVSEQVQLDGSAPTLAVGYAGRAGVVQVTDEAVLLVRGSSAPQRWTPPVPATADGNGPIGAAAVSELAGLVAVAVGSDIVCCRPSPAGAAAQPFDEVGRFTCTGQVAAVGFHVPSELAQPIPTTM